MLKFKRAETEESLGFLPEEYLVKRRERRTNVMAVALFITVMASVAIAFVVTDRNWHDVRSARVMVNDQFVLATDQITAMEAYEVRVGKMLEKAHVAVGLLDAVPKSILIAEVIRRMPDGLSLLRFEYKTNEMKSARPKAPAVRSIASSKSRTVEEEKDVEHEPRRWRSQVEIEGLAPTDQEVSRFMDAMVDLKLMSRVRLEYSREKEIGEQVMREYRIVMTIGPNADVRQMVQVAEDGVAE
jgi:hypothetical protein